MNSHTRTGSIDPSPFGMCGTLRASGAELERSVRLAAEAGVRWNRDDLLWSVIQPTRNTWNWDAYDSKVDLLLEHGIQSLGLLCYGAPWAVSVQDAAGNPVIQSMPDLEAWKDFVAATVEHFRGRIHVWEMWNEPNIKNFWKPKPDPRAYARLLGAGHAEAKRADPACLVMANNTSCMDLDFHRAVFEEGVYECCDLVCAHPYRWPFLPERTDMAGDLHALAELCSHYGPVKPVWLSELGAPTHAGEGESSQWHQAVLLLRYYLVSLATGLVDKIFWYDFRDDGLDAKEPEHHFGIITRDQTPKLSHQALRMMSSAIEGFTFSGMVDLGRDVRCLAFTRERETRYAVWSEGQRMNAVVPAPVGDVTVMRLGRESETLSANGGWLRLGLSDAPAFIQAAG